MCSSSILLIAFVRLPSLHTRAYYISCLEETLPALSLRPSSPPRFSGALSTDTQAVCLMPVRPPHLPTTPPRTTRAPRTGRPALAPVSMENLQGNTADSAAVETESTTDRPVGMASGRLSSLAVVEMEHLQINTSRVAAGAYKSVSGRINGSITPQVAIRAESSSQLAQLRTANAALQAEVMQLRESSTQLAQLRTANAALQAEVMQLRESSTQLAQLRTANAALQAEVMQLRESSTQLAQLRTANAALQAEVMRLQDQVAEKERVRAGGNEAPRPAIENGSVGGSYSPGATNTTAPYAGRSWHPIYFQALMTPGVADQCPFPEALPSTLRRAELGDAEEIFRLYLSLGLQCRSLQESNYLLRTSLAEASMSAPRHMQDHPSRQGHDETARDGAASSRDASDSRGHLLQSTEASSPACGREVGTSKQSDGRGAADTFASRRARAITSEVSRPTLGNLPMDGAQAMDEQAVHYQEVCRQRDSLQVRECLFYDTLCIL